MERGRLEQDQFLDQVNTLREQGLTVRAIAAELGIHPSRAQRALKALQRRPAIDPPPEHGVTPNLKTVARDSFVGREREMTELKAALGDAFAGRGRLVMLVGEPGIGKTRTAQELAFHAEGEGAQVLWGWCYEEAGAPPYWPWVQPLRSYIHQQDSNRLRQQMGPGAADIAEIVPQVRERLPGVEQAPALEPEQARFRLFDSITSFLRNASRTQPIMLVLDDLHWADKPSVLLLRFLARQMAGSRLLVVGCYRDAELSRQHPLAETLAQLTREPVFQRHILRGLSQQDTGYFIQAMAGVRPPEELVETIYAQTEGNPLFMTEVIRLLREQGRLRGETINGLPPIQVPEGVRDIIGQRLNRLTVRCHQVLTVASIIGREFSLEQLGRVSEDLSEVQLLEVVEEAWGARIIEEVPDSATRYQFSHALVQETLASELSAARRARLHAHIGEALEVLYGPNVAAHAAELAYHFAGAVTVLGTDKLVHYSLLAGQQALDTYAWEDAIIHFQRGLTAKQAHPVDAQSGALLFGLGRAQLAVFPRQRMPEAMDNLHQAFEAFKQAGDTDQVVAVAEYPLPTSAGVLAGAAALLSRALALVPPDSLAAGRLLVRNGWDLGRRKGDYHGAQDAFNQALAIAIGQGDTNLEMDALAAAAEVDLFHLCCQESLGKNMRAIELARRQADDPRVLVQAHQRATLAKTIIGDLEGARLHASAALAPAEKLRDGFWLDSAHWGMQFVYRLEGEWLASREMGESSPTVSMDLRSLADRVMLEYELGDFSQGEAYLQRLLEDHRKIRPAPNTAYLMPAIVIPLAARISSAVGGVDIARATAEAILSSISATPLVITGARAGLGLLAVLQGDVLAAQEQYTALLSQRGTMLQTGVAATDRVLGLLAHATGSLDRAMEHFEDALAFCRKAGVRPELAWTCYDYAEALLERNGPGDHARAVTLLEEALNISSALEMRPLYQRATGIQERAESQPAKDPAYPSGLTAREVEVLRLIATGKSNREIAWELVVTARTVERHVTNIYRKINARNKADATAYALREGLCHFR